MQPAPYTAYAPVYDAAGLDRPGAELARAALAWLRAAGESPRVALDLACGTGAAALALAAEGLRVGGVDRAPAMLHIAAGRARGAGLAVGFAEADIRALRGDHGPRTTDDRPKTKDQGRQTLNPEPRAPNRGGDSDDAGDDRAWSSILGPSSYDLVTCFGALHELTGDGDLALAFGGAARRLRPGGWLAFDLWAPTFFAARADSDEVLHDGPDHMVAARLLLDGDGQVWGRRVVWFVREIERWWRGEETHELRAWTEAEALAALAGSGLTLALRREIGERVLYIARSARFACTLPNA